MHRCDRQDGGRQGRLRDGEQRQDKQADILCQLACDFRNFISVTDARASHLVSPPWRKRLFILKILQEC